MNYVKDILSGVAAIFIAEIVCSCSIFSPSGPKAIEMAGGAAMFVENLLSSLLWIVAGLSVWLFFTASRATTTWRVLLFWIPTLTVSVLVFAFVGLWAYMSIGVRDQYVR